MEVKKVLASEALLLAEVESLEQQNFSDPWGMHTLISTLEQAHGNIWVIREQAQVIAYLIFYIMGDEVEVARIVVHRDYQGQGYGKELMKKLLDFSKEANLKQVVLEVRESNVPAINLYKNQGFLNLGIRKKYYTNPVEDALVMSNLLKN